MDEKLKNSMKEGQSLEDVTIQIDLRSSSVELRSLEILAQVIVTSVANLIQGDGSVKLEKKELSLVETPGKILSVSKYFLFLDRP